ncbi:ABC transporter substrate-binding protein [Haloimpatiens sp. FM7330]|uniref:ABC transporter substrate-binding protein n=1 Tax=Haloimpatiens sp. FM7330 TaxID=3298610 RepID=UPI00363EA1DD
MKRKKRKLFAVLGLLTAFMLVFSGCKDKPKDNSDEKKPSVEQNEEKGKEDEQANNEETKPKSEYTNVIKASNPEKLPPAAGERKDTLVIGVHTPEGKFNPIYSSLVDDSYVVSLIFDGMVSNDEKGNPTPSLAEKWEISEDGKTYTFHLKDGVKFSNGDDLTTEDVEFTYTAICDPNYTGPRFDAVEKLEGYKEYHKGNAEKVKGIKVIDPHTISFTLTQVKAPAIYDFGYGIMSKKYYGFKKGNIKEIEPKFVKPMGSGAYIFKEYKPGQEVVLESNPNFWKGEPKVKNLIIKATTAENEIQQILAGEVDVCGIAARAENVQQIKDAGFLDMQIYPANGYTYIGPNLRLDKFKDKKVRQALTYGLNREGFVKAYFGEYADVCNGPMSPVSWAYTDDLKKYEYNPEKANQLLDEAGWVKKDDGWRYKDGKKFTIDWYTYTGSKYVATLIPIVKECWKKIGIDVRAELMEGATMQNKVFDKQEFQMYNMGWALSIDPDNLGIFGISQDVKGGYNTVGWRNEEGEKLLQDGIKTIDTEKRKEIYQKWLKIANEELPYIFIAQDKDIWVVSSRVKGFDISPYMDFTFNIEKVEIK